MYNESIKRRAYIAFVVKGKNPEAIKKELSREYPTLKANTIRKWIEDGKWEDEKKQISHRVTETLKEETVSTSLAIRRQTKTLREKIYEQLVSENAPQSKSLEGLSYVYKTLSSFEVQLEKSENAETLSPIQVVEMFLEILHSIPSVAIAIQKEWVKIEKQLRERLIDKQSREKNVN